MRDDKDISSIVEYPSETYIHYIRDASALILFSLAAKSILLSSLCWRTPHHNHHRHSQAKKPKIAGSDLEDGFAKVEEFLSCRVEAGDKECVPETDAVRDMSAECAKRCAQASACMRKKASRARRHAKKRVTFQDTAEALQGVQGLDVHGHSQRARVTFQDTALRCSRAEPLVQGNSVHSMFRGLLLASEGESPLLGQPPMHTSFRPCKASSAEPSIYMSAADRLMQHVTSSADIQLFSGLEAGKPISVFRNDNRGNIGELLRMACVDSETDKWHSAVQEPSGANEDVDRQTVLVVSARLDNFFHAMRGNAV